MAVNCGNWVLITVCWLMVATDSSFNLWWWTLIVVKRYDWMRATFATIKSLNVTNRNVIPVWFSGLNSLCCQNIASNPIITVKVSGWVRKIIIHSNINLDFIVEICLQLCWIVYEIPQRIKSQSTWSTINMTLINMCMAFYYFILIMKYTHYFMIC